MQNRTQFMSFYCHNLFFQIKKHQHQHAIAQHCLKMYVFAFLLSLKLTAHLSLVDAKKTVVEKSMERRSGS